MMKPAHAERITGYHVTALSPFGQRKRVPTVVKLDIREEARFIHDEEGMEFPDLDAARIRGRRVGSQHRAGLTIPRPRAR